MAISGVRHVRATRSAFSDVHALFRRTRSKVEVRRNTLKLRYWPEMHPSDEGGQVLDLDWSWIKALRDLRIGELRIQDEVEGRDNLRVIFYEAESDEEDGMRMIWILRVMQKKRQEFTSNDLAIFKARRALVIQRFYQAP